MRVSERVCVWCRREPARNPWVPFCSDRCKLQDLARWIDGTYRVPAERVEEELNLPPEAHDEHDEHD